MALYAIGDPHLSLGGSKPMDVFGPLWHDHPRKLREGFQCVQPEDTVVLCGDLSWGMSLEECEPDFAFLDSLPGRKVIVKGNHDYWWSTASKIQCFFRQHGFHFELLHNCALSYGELALCGTRGWFLDEEQNGHNEKLLRRELLRLETSLRAAGDREKLVFLHYPPIYQGYQCTQLLELLEAYHVRQCCFGHLHGASTRLAVEGLRRGTSFSLVSADYLQFVPKKICP